MIILQVMDFESGVLKADASERQKSGLPGNALGLLPNIKVLLDGRTVTGKAETWSVSTTASLRPKKTMWLVREHGIAPRFAYVLK
jgi:hypothetical protein